MSKLNRRCFLGYSMASAGALAIPRCALAGSHIDLSGGIDPAREFVLQERPTTPGMRDAVNIWMEEERGAFALRLGVEAVAEEWDRQLVWLDIAFPDGRVLSLRDLSGKTHSALDQQGRPTVRGSGGARFQCMEPFRHWRATFEGAVPATTAVDLINDEWPQDPPTAPVEFAIDMYMAVPPWQPGTLLGKNDTTYAGEQGDFISPRYEQLFRGRGAMSIGDKSYSFSGPGLRIRRTGVRKFKGFWGHCWQSAVFPSGKAFGFNTFPPRKNGTPSYNEGYIFDGSGVLQPARAIKVPWMTELTPQGDDVSFILQSKNGEVAIEGKTFINTRSRIPPGSEILPADFPVVQQAHAFYRWDGEETVGMVERSSRPEVLRST